MTPPDLTLSTALRAATRAAILRALVATDGHHGDAARLLGVSPRTMQRLVAEHLNAGELIQLGRIHLFPPRGGRPRAPGGT